MEWWGDDLHDFEDGDQIVAFVGRYPSIPPINGQIQWGLEDKFTVRDGRAVNFYNELALADLITTVTALAAQ